MVQGTPVLCTVEVKWMGQSIEVDNFNNLLFGASMSYLITVLGSRHCCIWDEYLPILDPSVDQIKSLLLC